MVQTHAHSLARRHTLNARRRHRHRKTHQRKHTNTQIHNLLLLLIETFVFHLVSCGHFCVFAADSSADIHCLYIVKLVHKHSARCLGLGSTNWDFIYDLHSIARTLWLIAAKINPRTLCDLISVRCGCYRFNVKPFIYTHTEIALIRHLAILSMHSLLINFPELCTQPQICKSKHCTTQNRWYRSASKWFV